MRDDGPSLTARGVAIARATLDRPSSPSGDPAGDARLEADLVEGWASRDPGRVLGWVTARTHFFDAEVLAALEAGTRQVVILGAGYDGRALRFRTPGVTFFEVDHPHTQADKRARLARLDIAADDVAFVAHDLVTGSLEAALAAAGHDLARPTLFLAEGLLRYLPEATVHHLFDATAAMAAPGSVLAVTFSTREPDSVLSEDEQARERFLAATGETVVTVPPRAVALQWLADADWHATDVDGMSAPNKSPGDGRLLVRAVLAGEERSRGCTTPPPW